MMTTREQLIDSAMRNLYQFGYNRFSFAHVAKDCSIAKASIHYHFPSKDTLVLAAIDKYTNDQKEFLESLKHNNQLDTLEKFEKLFDHAYERMKAKNYIGCLAGNLGLEISETNQTILTRINEFMNYKLTWFVDLIETGKKSGLLRKNAGTQRIAQNNESQAER